MTKKKKAAADAAVNEETKQADTTPQEKKSNEPMVTVLKTGTASKLSPRGDGKLFYQVGRMGDIILLRISGNDSSGRFSKEWVCTQAIRESLNRLPNLKAFKGAGALKSAWKGQSSCNSGFGAGILKAEGVFTPHPDPKMKGALMLSSPDALEAFEQKMLDLPIPKDAEKLLLNPPKTVPNFGKKKAAKDAPDADNDAEEVDDSDAENIDIELQDADLEDDPADDDAE